MRTILAILSFAGGLSLSGSWPAPVPENRKTVDVIEKTVINGDSVALIKTTEISYHYRKF